MVVVRRRADGVYWRNTTGAGAWCNNEGVLWTDNLQDIKPFRNAGAAHNAMGYSNKQWPPRDKNYKVKSGLPECCLAVKWNSRGGYMRQCVHYKLAIAEMQAKWNDTYELLEVTLVITQSLN